MCALDFANVLSARRAYNQLTERTKRKINDK